MRVQVPHPPLYSRCLMDKAHGYGPCYCRFESCRECFCPTWGRFVKRWQRGLLHRIANPETPALGFGGSNPPHFVLLQSLNGGAVVLKTTSPKGLAGSNPVCSVRFEPRTALFLREKCVTCESVTHKGKQEMA